MIDITLNWEEETKTYSIPTGWDDVSVEKFSKLFGTDTSEAHDIYKAVTHISLLSGIPKEELYDLTPEQFHQVAENFSFMNSKVEGELQEYVEVEGEKYYLKSEFKSYTFGEQASIEVILEQNNNNVMGCMDKLLCIMLRKKVDGKLEKFNTDFMERYELFKNIPISQVYQLFTFFLNTNEE